MTEKKTGKPPKRLAIIGKMGAGKSTVASLLKNRYGYKELAFATPIKEIAKNLFFMEKKDRALLQDIGQALRSVRDTVFVDYLIKNIPEGEAVIVSDVRQKNEYEALKKAGFIFVRINCDLNERIYRIEQRDGIVVDKVYMERLNHISENDLDDVKADLEINNSKRKDFLIGKKFD